MNLFQKIKNKREERKLKEENKYFKVKNEIEPFLLKTKQKHKETINRLYQNNLENINNFIVEELSKKQKITEKDIESFVNNKLKNEFFPLSLVNFIYIVYFIIDNFEDYNKIFDNISDSCNNCITVLKNTEYIEISYFTMEKVKFLLFTTNYNIKIDRNNLDNYETKVTSDIKILIQNLQDYLTNNNLKSYIYYDCWDPNEKHLEILYQEIKEKKI